MPMSAVTLRPFRHLVFLLILAACARPLTSGETKFANTIFASDLATKRVRVAPFRALTTITARRPARPRIACRERIYPAPQGKTVTTYTAAFVLYNRINIARSLYQPDFAPNYPKEIRLDDAMLIAHELTHVWQWQHRRETHYTPLKALNEHKPGQDPYLLNLRAKPDFLDFPYEQQGAIVEEYVCCLNLDPTGARTKRLHDMLAPVLPLAKIGTRPHTKVILPWSGAKTQGICA